MGSGGKPEKHAEHSIEYRKFLKKEKFSACKFRRGHVPLAPFPTPLPPTCFLAMPLCAAKNLLARSLTHCVSVLIDVDMMCIHDVAVL